MLSCDLLPSFAWEAVSVLPKVKILGDQVLLREPIKASDGVTEGAGIADASSYRNDEA